MSRIRALLVTDPLIVLVTALLGTASMVTSIWDRKGRAQHAMARVWARSLLAVSGIHVHVEGLENLDPRQSYVLVSNHQSLIDTPAALAYIPLQFRFFAKRGLFKIPFVGWHLRRAGHFQVVREDPRGSIRSMVEAARVLSQEGYSALVFPEGGRAPQGMRAFKEGAAYLAIKANIPVVPIGLSGSRQALPMGSINIRPGKLHIRVGQPIPTSGLTLRDRGELTLRLRARVAELAGVEIDSVEAPSSAKPL
jgi:1-acyl-sn-glycerol-3-phosphate acyltransferase